MKRDTLIRYMYMIQCTFLIANHILNCTPRQVNIAEANAKEHIGNKENFFMLSRHLKLIVFQNILN